MRVLFVATYELGQQPGNLAGPAGRLRERGHEVRLLDTSLDPWDPTFVDWADRVAFSVPMHTATRLARELATTIAKPVCCYGLYASMCADVADAVIAGEYEDALVAWAEGEPIRVPVQLGSARRKPRAVAAPARGSSPRSIGTCDWRSVTSYGWSVRSKRAEDARTAAATAPCRSSTTAGSGSPTRLL